MSKTKPQLPSYFDHLTGLEGQDELMEIEIQLLKRSTVQPRRYFNPQAMRELESSIRDKGIQTPILVRRAGEHYEIVAGERRHRAAAAVGLRTVPVLVKDLNDEQAQELALLDNLQREDLNPIEETDGVLRLLSVKLNMSLEDAIRIIRAIYDEGRGRAGNNVVSMQAKEAVDQVFTGLGRFTPSSFYTHRVPLLRLPQELLDAVRRGELSYSKARLLAQVGDAETRNVLLNRTTVQALSIRKLREEIKRHVRGSAQAPEEPQAMQRVTAVRKLLTNKRYNALDMEAKRRLEKLLREVESILVLQPDFDH